MRIMNSFVNFKTIYCAFVQSNRVILMLIISGSPYFCLSSIINYGRFINSVFIIIPILDTNFIKIFAFRLIRKRLGTRGMELNDRPTSVSSLQNTGDSQTVYDKRFALFIFFPIQYFREPGGFSGPVDFDPLVLKPNFYPLNGSKIFFDICLGHLPAYAPV